MQKSISRTTSPGIVASLDGMMKDKPGMKRISIAICCVGLAWLSLDYGSVVCGIGAVIAFTEVI